MKKCLFMVVLLLMTSISFASTANEAIKKNIENNESVQIQNYSVVYDYKINLLNDGCFVSCYANIYYNGKLVQTVNASAIGSDCVVANQECGRQAYALAKAYIAEAEEQKAE